MIRLICAVLLVGISVLSIGAAAIAVQPATIVIRTDGYTSSIEVSGGDVGYPGPSQIVIEHDALGIVVVSRTRLFVGMQRVWLPGVMR